VKELTEIEGTFTGPEAPEPDDDELPPQAASTRPAIAASEIVMLFLVTSSKKTTFCRQSRSPDKGESRDRFSERCSRWR
jgi:hypothetical protein